MSTETLDDYCERLNIAPEEMPAAFAAWLSSQTGWDGDMKPVDETDGSAPGLVDTRGLQ